MSGQKAAQLFEALDFYNKNNQSSPKISKLLNDFSDRIGECMPAKNWRKEIQENLENIPGSEHIADDIYNNCFITSRGKVKGSRVNGQKLDRIVRTFDDFKKYNGYDKILKSVS